MDNFHYDIVKPAIEDYVTALVPARPPVLARVEEEAYQHNVPIVGPLEGQALALLARLVKAKSILEVGTATGYSAIWLGQVAKENAGRLTGIEFDAARRAEAQKNLADAGLGETVDVLLGDARDVVAGLTGPYDFIFFDLVRSLPDEHQLLRMYELCADRLKVGGVFCLDNVLHGGDVLDPKTQGAHSADHLNQTIACDGRFVASFLTIRDGLAVALKVRE
ncbi:MAG TPA: O-methyltransferase [Chloroflexota bacterium]|nr:O-methyltransferase [Chloroflexota bacterium]